MSEMCQEMPCTVADLITCLSRAKKLLSKFPESAVDFIFFTDEKVFSVALTVNLQNDHVYTPCRTKKHDIAVNRLFHTRLTFSKSVMASERSQNLDALNCTSWSWK